MAYTEKNFTTAKAVRDAFKTGETLRVYQPGPFGSGIPDGTAYLEGPHFPEPHRWYLAVEVKDGVITKIRR